MATLPIRIPLPFRSVPLEMRAGDMQTWQVDLSDLAPGAYTLSYVFSGVIAGVPRRFSFLSGDIGDVADLFTVTAPSSETSAWLPGFYLWICFVVDESSNRIQIAQGRVKILPDVAGSAAPIDPRSSNEKLLWAIGQLISGKAVADVMIYEVAGRRIEKMKIQDLMYWRGIVSGWVKRERKARGEYVLPSSAGIAFGGNY